MEKQINSLCDFLNTAHSSFHAVACLEKMLQQEGYLRIFEEDPWELAPGGKYYVIRGGTALTAFRIPQGTPKGFLISASHSDRPCFKVRRDAAITGPYTRLSVERYGGMLMFTWLDRPLSVAGRVMVDTGEGIESRLIDIDRDLLLIPSVAIHMNREVNEGYKWNPAVDMVPLVGGTDAAAKLRELLEKAAGGPVLGHDLFLYIREPAKIWGLNNEYISSAALDDLACAWACTQGLLHAQESSSIPVLCVFDNEEVGSSSAQGACSTFLADSLERICQSRKLDIRQLLARSFMVSADNGHALHPNHPELADSTHAPLMGEGIVIKYNAALKYCTNGFSAALFRKVCQKAGVKTQTYFNRPDIVGGSTLGNLSQHQVGIPTVDVGLPQLAMHSCYETAAVADALAMEKAMATFYSATLDVQGDACILN